MPDSISTWVGMDDKTPTRTLCRNDDFGFLAFCYSGAFNLRHAPPVIAPWWDEGGSVEAQPTEESPSSGAALGCM